MRKIFASLAVVASLTTLGLVGTATAAEAGSSRFGVTGASRFGADTNASRF